MSVTSLSLLKSLGLHFVLGGFLVLSVTMHTPTKHAPQVSSVQPIKAVAIDESALKQQMDKIKQQKNAQVQAEEKRVKDLERRAREAENRRKKEQDRIRDIEAQKRQQLAEKKKADQAAAQARETQKLEAEKTKKLEEQRINKERERSEAEELARQAKEKREREEKALKDLAIKKQQEQEAAEQERILQEQMEAELAMQNQRRSKHVLSESEKYQALIYQAIKSRLLTDDSMKGKSCKINVLLASSGFVKQAKVLGGDASVCRAAENAVLKAGSLPMSKEADVYQELKDITLIFNL